MMEKYLQSLSRYKRGITKNCHLAEDDVCLIERIDARVDSDTKALLDWLSIRTEFGKQFLGQELIIGLTM